MELQPCGWCDGEGALRDLEGKLSEDCPRCDGRGRLRRATCEAWARNEVSRAWHAGHDTDLNVCEQIAWTVERCNAAMGDGFSGTPNSAVAAVCDEVNRLREWQRIGLDNLRGYQEAFHALERLAEEWRIALVAATGQVDQRAQGEAKLRGAIADATFAILTSRLSR